MVKVAVVTGSNKGIGYAIVRGLCQKFDGVVYLTSRDIRRGEEAVAKLKEEGLNPKYHQLDITDQGSVDKFRDYIKNTHGGLDLLVNNAAILFQPGTSVPFAVQAEETIRVNYYGTLRVCEALFPLLRQNARVVTVSSSAGFLRNIRSETLRAKFSEPDLTIERITNLMEKFVNDAKAGKSDQEGWAVRTYEVSKVGVSALSIAYQRIFDQESPNRNIAINHVHPGYVGTDMTDHKGRLTIEEGARSALFCAFEADLKGQYVWYDCQIVDWYGESTPNS